MTPVASDPILNPWVASFDPSDLFTDRPPESEAMFAGGRFAESREAEIEIPQWSHVAFSAMLAGRPEEHRDDEGGGRRRAKKDEGHPDHPKKGGDL